MTPFNPLEISSAAYEPQIYNTERKPGVSEAQWNRTAERLIEILSNKLNSQSI